MTGKLTWIYPKHQPLHESKYTLGSAPRPVTVVKDLPFGLIGASYYSPFGTVTGWGQFPT